MLILFRAIYCAYWPTVPAPCWVFSCICWDDGVLVYSEQRWSRNRFYNTTYRHAVSRTHLCELTVSLCFGQLFPLCVEIFSTFFDNCLPDLRHSHWVFSKAKGSWPQQNTHIYCLSHKNFYVFNLEFMLLFLSIEGVGSGGVCGVYRRAARAHFAHN